MLSQGEYTNYNSGQRRIYEVWGYKTGHPPTTKVINNGTDKIIVITPIDSQNITDYQVMIPASDIGLTARTDSLEIEPASEVSPIANFTANPKSGSASLSVQFTDTSIGNPTSWSWDFNNDGTTDSTSQNPTYTYSSVGNYTVKLTVTNLVGSDSEAKTNYITVTDSQPLYKKIYGKYINPFINQFKNMRLHLGDTLVWQT
jgi:PKD repeat protein